MGRDPNGKVNGIDEGTDLRMDLDSGAVSLATKTSDSARLAPVT